MAAPQSTPLPEAPQRGEPEGVFIPKSNAFVASLEPFRQELQSQADYTDIVYEKEAQIDELYAKTDDISTVAGISEDVATVAGNTANVNTVAGIDGDISTVSGIAPDVTAVAGNNADVSAVAANELNINTVAGIDSDVTTVAGIAADVSAAVPLASDLVETAALSRRQARLARSLAVNPPIGPETLRLDYAQRAFARGDAGEGLTDTVEEFDVMHTFTRASAGTYFDATGTLVEAGVDEPRFTHDPETGEALGLLIEEQRTNLLLWSADFSKSPWAKGRSSISANVAEAPDGTVTADKHIPDSNAGAHQLYQVMSVTEGVTYSCSVYAKADGWNGAAIYCNRNSSFAMFDIVNGTILSQSRVESASIKPVGNGWFLISATYVVEAGLTSDYAQYRSALDGKEFIGGDGTSGVLFWGGSFEEGSFPASYISTEGTQVTRAADDCSRTLGAEYSSAEGSVLVTAAVPTGETVVALGSESIVSDSDAEKTYTLSYGADPSATTLDIAPNASFATVKNVTYKPRA